MKHSEQEIHTQRRRTPSGWGSPLGITSRGHTGKLSRVPVAEDTRTQVRNSHDPLSLLQSRGCSPPASRSGGALSRMTGTPGLHSGVLSRVTTPWDKGSRSRIITERWMRDDEKGSVDHTSDGDDSEER